MRPPDTNGQRPPQALSKESVAAADDSGSLAFIVDHSDEGVVETLAHTLIEMRPDISPAVAATMVVEALDKAACLTLDAEWAHRREAAYPAALRAAHARHSLLSYQRRRAQQLDDIKPREGDYPGRWNMSPYWREAFDKAHDIPMCPDACSPRPCWGDWPNNSGVECRPPVATS